MKPLNYFFSLRKDLKSEHPRITYLEILTVIWVLAEYIKITPEFDWLSLPANELPLRLRSNGAVNIDRERVAEIAGTVIDEYKTADIELSAIVGQTASDEQDVFIPPSQTFSFTGPIFDITSLPNGALLVADFGSIKEVKNDGISENISLPVAQGSGAFGAEQPTFINGLSSIGGGSFSASRGALDLALSAALFSVPPATARWLATSNHSLLVTGQTVNPDRNLSGSIADVKFRADLVPACKAIPTTSPRFPEAKLL